LKELKRSKTTGRLLKKGAARRRRGDCVFPAEHPKVLDNADHFPINTVSQARNALARCAQYDSAPKWYKGSLASLQKTVRRAVKKKYPSIEVTEPGPGGRRVKLAASKERGSKPILEVKVVDSEGNDFEVRLVDDGTSDTVIDINGREFRFSSEFASYWRDEDGNLSEEGLKELALDALANLDQDEYVELLSAGLGKGEEEEEAAPESEAQAEKEAETAEGKVPSESDSEDVKIDKLTEEDDKKDYKCPGSKIRSKGKGKGLGKGKGKGPIGIPSNEAAEETAKIADVEDTSDVSPYEKESFENFPLTKDEADRVGSKLRGLGFRKKTIRRSPYSDIFIDRYTSDEYPGIVLRVSCDGDSCSLDVESFTLAWEGLKSDLGLASEESETSESLDERKHMERLRDLL